MVRFVQKVQRPHPHELGAVAVGAQTISYPSPPSSLLLPHPPWRGQHRHLWGPVPTFEIWGHSVVQVSPGNRSGALRQSLVFWRALSTCVLRAKRLVPASWYSTSVKELHSELLFLFEGQIKSNGL